MKTLVLAPDHEAYQVFVKKNDCPAAVHVTNMLQLSTHVYEKVTVVVMPNWHQEWFHPLDQTAVREALQHQKSRGMWVVLYTHQDGSIRT